MTDTDWKARLTAVRDVLSALSEAGCPTHDPHDGTCSVCNVLDSVDAALDALSSLTDAARTHDDRVRAEGDAAGYARGVEDAAMECDVSGSDSGTRASTLRNAARRIRVLAARGAR